MLRHVQTIEKMFRTIKSTNFNAMARTIHAETYREAFDQARNDPETFWAEKAERLVWFKKWDKVLTDRDTPFAKWFKGGQINITYNCLDRHIEDGHATQVAVVQDSPVTGTRTQLTFETLLDQVSNLAGYFARKCGVNKGDRILIYMPMIPECLIAMLAAARIGAIHTVVFGGFSPEQLAVRIRNAKPRVIVTASYGIEPKRRVAYKAAVKAALNMSECANLVDSCIFYHRPILPRVKITNPKFFVDWGEALAASTPHDPIPMDATDPLYLIYTSGTTGNPKGIVRDTGGYAVSLKYTADKIYDIKPNDMWWAASEFGWVVGHSYCGYAPLLQRATSIIYEGKPIGTPDAAQFFRVAAENKVNGWFMTPSAARAIRSEDPNLNQSSLYRSTGINLNNLRNVFVAGEHCDMSTAHWLVKHLPPHVKFTDTWWQTESGWPITSCCLGYPDGYLNPTGLLSPEGSAGLPVPGYNITMVDQDEGNTSSQSIDLGQRGFDETKVGKLRRILVKLPLPPGNFTTIYNDDKRYEEYYFKKYPGYYDTMDLGFQDENGYIYILSRADDVINVSGHRLSTSALEEACLAVDDIVDCAVIAIPHDVKGHVPFGILVHNPQTNLTDDELIDATIKSVRKIVGPVAAFSRACIVPKLPKTRSGKIARGSLAEMASGKPVKVPITIDDISVYRPIYKALKAAGLEPSVAPDKL